MPRWSEIHFIRQIQPFLRSKWARPTAALLTFLLVMPMAALAQGSPFDTGFNAIQGLFTGTIGLRFHLPRQPRGHALYRRPGKTWAPISSRCLEDIRSGNQSTLLHRPRNWDRVVKMLTSWNTESSPFICVFKCLSSYRNRGRYY